MDIGLLLQHSQYAIPVGIVLVCAILVFAFGFKKAEQPPFAQLSAGSDVDRKLAKKRGKTREKKATNGQIATEKTSPIKKTLAAKAEATKKSVAAMKDDVDGKLKERKQENDKTAVAKKEKEQSMIKTGKENKVEHVKNKKNLKNMFQEKPVDFDDGDWEQAYSRKDKKNKKKEEESPSKKNKKTPKKADLINEAKQTEQEKPEIKDKIAKETENKELKEKERKEIVLTPISNEDTGKTKDLQKEEQNKIDKIEKEEKKMGKSKKTKKVSEGEGTSTLVSSTLKTDEPVEEHIQNKPVNMEKLDDNIEETKAMQTQEKAAVFDELGDVWTEAKPLKKSKKKSRKDN